MRREELRKGISIVMASLVCAGAMAHGAGQVQREFGSGQPEAEAPSGSSITGGWESTGARQLDFLLGTWDVDLSSSEEKIGRGHAERARVRICAVLDGRAVLELWDSSTIQGVGLRYYDSGRGKWSLFRTWLDGSVPTFIQYEGTVRDGFVEFLASDGGVVRRRKLRELDSSSFETDDAYSKDGGKTWNSEGVRKFRRASQAASPSSVGAGSCEFKEPHPGGRRNDLEVGPFASLTGRWRGEVEWIQGGHRSVESASALAFRLLGDHVMLLLTDFERNGDPIRSLSILTFSPSEERYSELSFDSRKGSSALVLHGSAHGGLLTMQSETRSHRTLWTFADAAGHLLIERQRQDGSRPLSQKFVLEKVTGNKDPKEYEMDLKLEDAINQTCPRSGKPVVADSLAIYRGVTVGFCNQHCRDDFAANVDERPHDREYFDGILAKRE